MLTRDEVAQKFHASQSAGFSASPDSEKAIDALHTAQGAAAFDPVAFINLIQLLTPFISSLPQLISLLTSIFKPAA